MYYTNGLNRVAKFLRSKCCNIDRLVSFIKKTLTKNKANIALFYEIFETPLPNLPILSRWGTWLTFVFQISKNFQKYIEFVANLNDTTTDVVSIRLLLNSEAIIFEFNFISKYQQIPIGITKLESTKLNTSDQIKILKELKMKINVIG